MTIDLIVVGKTDSEAVNALVTTYLKRINFYTKCSFITVPDIRNTKNLSTAEQKRLEGEAILKQLSAADYVVLLDEHGAEMRSMEFAVWLQKRMNSGIKRMVFVIGGPYGFSDEIYKRANDKISLSRMTFSHQIIRAIFFEQLYRGFTIIRNEPYHHE